MEALATVPRDDAGTTPGVFTENEVDTLKMMLANKATDVEFKMFLAICKRTGLDPFARQIWAIKRRRYNAEDKQWEGFLSVETSIDGLRLIAQRTGERDGEDEPEWIDESGAAFNVWLKDTPPYACRVRVYRKGHSKPYVGIAYWRFYKQTKKAKHGGDELTHMWDKGGPSMLAKCAEALALRKGFPNELGGLYTSEEMQQADVIEIGESATSELQARNLNSTDAWAKPHLERWKDAAVKALAFKRKEPAPDKVKKQAGALLEAVESWWIENGADYVELEGRIRGDARAHYPLDKIQQHMLQAAGHLGGDTQSTINELIQYRLKMQRADDATDVAEAEGEPAEAEVVESEEVTA